ncbi:MAG: carboxypeptidase-like regulatory domain-containing protein [Cytophagales bacterium]|nr:carboxypeptidase-like regulatory domain-containing protein [Cytophagales bacterium]
MNRISVMLLLMGIGHFTIAQKRSVFLGIVVDQVTKTAIPYAHVTFDGTAVGTSANLDGQFELKIPASALPANIRISCIGYESITLAVAKIPSDRQRINLAPVTTALDGVVVSADKPKKKELNQARRLVKRALRRIPKNYSDEAIHLPAFYRHYCAENDNYVRLIESALDITRSGKDPYKAYIPQENLGFEISQLRRSFDFTQNARLSHPPISLNYLLTGDLTSYEYSNPLLALNTKYQLTDTTSFNNQVVYVVDFDTPRDLKRKAFHGRLYIAAKSLAFLRIDFSELTGRKTISDSTDVQLDRITFYKKHQDKYFLDRSSADVYALKLSYDTLGRTIDSIVHTSHIELITNNILPNPEKEKGGLQPTAEDLVNVDYDSTFWDNYNILQATKIEDKIISDLSRKLDLRKQFALFNTIEEGGKSIISSDAFQSIIAKYKDTPTYVVIWSGRNHPNHFDVEPHKWLAKRLKRDKAQLLLVSIDDTDEKWQLAREVYQLNIKGVMHERMSFEFDSELLADLFSNVLPFYCFFDKSGELINTNPPLPAREDVQLLLSAKSSR